MAKAKYVTSGSNIQELIEAVKQSNTILAQTQDDGVVDTYALKGINNVLIDIDDSIKAIEKIVVGNYMKDLEKASEQSKYNEQILDALKGLKPKPEEKKEKSGDFSWLGLAGALIGGLVMGGLAFVKNYIKGFVGFWTKAAKMLKLDVLVATLFKYIKAPFDFIKGGFIRMVDYIADLFKGSDLLKMLKGNVLKLFTFIGDFFGFSGKGLFKDFVRMFESVGDMISGTAKAIGGFFSKIFSLGGGEGGLFAKIASAMDFFQPLTKFFKSFGSILGKLAYPIQVVLSVFDTVTGALDGWNNTEGDFMAKFFGALKGGVTGLLNGLIGGLLDLIKDGMSWLVNLLGFENAAKVLDSFSFSDLIKRGVEGFYNFIEGMIRYVMDIFKDPGKLVADVGDLFGKISDMAKNFLKTLLRSVLPNPASDNPAVRFAAKAIPDAVYDFAGMNPKTGELQGATVDNVAAKGEQMVNQAVAAGQQAVQGVVNAGQTIINNGNTALMSARSKVRDTEDMLARGWNSLGFGA
jgi:hypothetical protein